MVVTALPPVLPQPVQNSASLATAPLATAQPALGNLPPQAVVSTLSSPETRNNRQGRAPTPPPAVPQSAPSSEATALLPLAQMARGGGMLTASSPFMAQLLAQGGGESVLSPETLEQFANTRYMPSNAAKPTEPMPRFGAEFSQAEPEVVAEAPAEPVALTEPVEIPSTELPRVSEQHVEMHTNISV